MKAETTSLKPLDIAQELFELLEAEGVKHCHWKSNRNLDRALEGRTDLDVLVDNCDAKSCERLLSGLNCIRVLSQTHKSYPGIEDWLGFDERSGKLIHVHLHYRLLTGRKYIKEQHLPWEELILETAIKDFRYGIYTTEPNLEMLLLLVRVSLKTSIKQIAMSLSRGKTAFSSNIEAEFGYLAEQINSDRFRQLAFSLLGKQASQLMSEIVMQHSFHHPRKLVALRRVVRRQLASYRRFTRMSLLKRYVISIVHPYAFLLRRKLRLPMQLGKRPHSGGKVIAFLGCDGAGKTTVSKEIHDWLSWKLDVHSMYLGSGVGLVGKLHNLERKVVPKIKEPTPPSKLNEINAKPKTSILKDIRDGITAILLARQRLQKVRNAYRMKLGGQIVLTDRYPQHQITGIYDGPALQAGEGASAFRKWCAQYEFKKYQRMGSFSPDIVVKLHLPAKTALQRKPHHDYDIIQRKGELTQEISFTGATVIDIDASPPLEQVIQRVKAEIWQKL